MGELEELLALALEEILAGRVPAVSRLSHGDEALGAALTTALAAALQHLPPASISAPARTLGPYRILGPLGSGGMGTVYLAVHEGSGSRVALKILPFPFWLSSEHCRRFRREAETLAKVRHPAVVPVLEVGEHEGTPYLVMEYIEGGTLDDRIRRLQRLDFASARVAGTELLPGAGPYELRAARLLLEILRGADAIHCAELVHRDLKPANILMSATGQPVIADFGLALEEGAARLTGSGSIVGTRQYLAPELTHPGARATRSTDLYAIGVTLFELLTLRAPFADADPDELARNIRRHDPPDPRRFNRRIPDALVVVCERALEKTPRDRYPDAATMARDLAAAIDGRPVRRPLLAIPRRLVRGARYHRRRIAAAVFGTAALAAVGAFSASVLQQARAEREARWLRAFRDGETLLGAEVITFDMEADRHRERLEEARRQFRACTEVFPDRSDAWLRLAESGVFLGERDAARTVLGEARRLGASGWYVETLEARADERAVKLDWIPAGSAAMVTSSWQALDRVALARELMRARRHEEAIELLLDPRLEADPRLMVAAEIASFLHRDVAMASSVVFKDDLLQGRMALHYYDCALERCPDSETVCLGRAVLIRDQLAFGKRLGDTGTGLLDSALADFRAIAERRNTPAARAAYSNCLYVAERPAEALAAIEGVSDDDLSRVPTADRVSAVKTFALNHRLDRAFALLDAPGFTPPWGASLGPLGRLVQLVGFLRTWHPAEAPGVDELEAFADSIRSRVSAQDWETAIAELAALGPR